MVLPGVDGAQITQNTDQERENADGAVSGGKALGVASFGFGSLGFPVAWGCVGFERGEKVDRSGSDGVDCGQEGRFVGLGGLVEATDLADELKGGGADFFRGGGRVEI
jgi:hypothetical protein